MITPLAIVSQAELMKKKLPWLKYDMLKKEFIEVIQEQEKIAKKTMEEAAKVLEDSKQPIEYVLWFQYASNVHFFLQFFSTYFFLVSSFTCFGICSDDT